jgi:hypothetical protein
MDQDELRLECLKLALSHPPARSAVMPYDPIAAIIGAAKLYADFVIFGPATALQTLNDSQDAAA